MCCFAEASDMFGRMNSPTGFSKLCNIVAHNIQVQHVARECAISISSDALFASLSLTSGVARSHVWYLRHPHDRYRFLLRPTSTHGLSPTALSRAVKLAATHRRTCLFNPRRKTKSFLTTGTSHGSTTQPYNSVRKSPALSCSWPLSRLIQLSGLATLSRLASHVHRSLFSPERLALASSQLSIVPLVISRTMRERAPTGTLIRAEQVAGDIPGDGAHHLTDCRPERATRLAIGWRTGCCVSTSSDTKHPFVEVRI